MARLTGSIRIIGGRWRGRKLAFEDSKGLRPTSDRLRETLFNWLQPNIAAARCLDAFAGSGALGFEAMSRGADSVVMLEHSARVATHLRKNTDQLQANGIDIHAVNALDWLVHEPPKPFDIVFLDPPFSEDLLQPCVEALSRRGWLREQAQIYLELPREAKMPDLPDNWTLFRSKSAGKVQYHLATFGR